MNELTFFISSAKSRLTRVTFIVGSFRALSASNRGSSLTQGAHQVAQKFMTCTFSPFSSRSEWSLSNFITSACCAKEQTLKEKKYRKTNLLIKFINALNFEEFSFHQISTDSGYYPVHRISTKSLKFRHLESL